MESQLDKVTNTVSTGQGHGRGHC